MFMVGVLYSFHNYLEYFDGYLVALIVGIVSCLLFFDNRLGYDVLYPLVFCIIVLVV